MMGYLSQAVANLLATEQQIRSMSGLPAAAQAVQSASATLVGNLVPDIRSTQGKGTGFVATALPQLNEIETMLSNNANLPQIKAQMAVVMQEVLPLQSAVHQLVTEVSSASQTLFGYFNQLASIEAQINDQMTSLQGQLGNAQGELDAAKKRYYYLLALGPFGLIGLAVALGLYLKWRNDVNGYENQINQLNGQIASLSAMNAASHALGQGFQGLVAKLSGVKNSVDFLASEVLAIDSELNANDAPIVIAIKVRAAITEVNTLGIDLS
jgi:hypothetical protein